MHTAIDKVKKQRNPFHNAYKILLMHAQTLD